MSHFTRTPALRAMISTRCIAPGGGGTWGAPVAVKALEVGKEAQSFERGKPFLVLNPIDDFIHVVYREEEERDLYEGFDNDAWWTTYQYSPCP